MFCVCFHANMNQSFQITAFVCWCWVPKVEERSPCYKCFQKLDRFYREFKFKFAFHLLIFLERRLRRTRLNNYVICGQRWNLHRFCMKVMLHLSVLTRNGVVCASRFINASWLCIHWPNSATGFEFPFLRLLHVLLFYSISLVTVPPFCAWSSRSFSSFPLSICTSFDILVLFSWFTPSHHVSYFPILSSSP